MPQTSRYHEKRLRGLVPLPLSDLARRCVEAIKTGRHSEAGRLGEEMRARAGQFQESDLDAFRRAEL